MQNEAACISAIVFFGLTLDKTTVLLSVFDCITFTSVFYCDDSKDNLKVFSVYNLIVYSQQPQRMMKFCHERSWCVC